MRHCPCSKNTNDDNDDNDDNDERHESEANPKNFSKQLQIINRDMSVGDVFNMLGASFKSVVIHANTRATVKCRSPGHATKQEVTRNCLSG